MRRFSTIVIIALSTLLFVSICSAQHESKTPSTLPAYSVSESAQLNSLTALEATSDDLIAAVATLQGGSQPLGQWSGSVTSAGWNLQFMGQINQVQTTISQTGTFNGGHITWVDSGMLGDQPITGSGSFEVAQIDARGRSFAAVGAIP